MQETTTSPLALNECERCHTPPELTQKPTPLGMRSGVPFTEIKCPKCQLAAGGYGEESIAAIWNATNGGR